jgi:repressor LexA
MTDKIQGIILRLKECIEKSGLTYMELEKKTGIAKSSIQRYANGSTKKIPIDAIQAIAKAVDVPATYIMGWEQNVTPLSSDNVFMRPLYESVAAGFGAPAVNQIISYIPTYINNVSEKDKYIWVRVQGDSMFPKIEDGDKILIRLQDSVDSGQVGVVLIDGEEAVVKKINYDTDYIELISFNPYYPPRRFEGADVQRIRVVGLVREVNKELQ